MALWPSKIFASARKAQMPGTPEAILPVSNPKNAKADHRGVVAYESPSLAARISDSNLMYYLYNAGTLLGSCFAGSYKMTIKSAKSLAKRVLPGTARPIEAKNSTAAVISQQQQQQPIRTFSPPAAPVTPIHVNIHAEKHSGREASRYEPPTMLATHPAAASNPVGRTFGL